MADRRRKVRGAPFVTGPVGFFIDAALVFHQLAAGARPLCRSEVIWRARMPACGNPHPPFIPPDGQSVYSTVWLYQEYISRICAGLGAMCRYILRSYGLFRPRAALFSSSGISWRRHMSPFSGGPAQPYFYAPACGGAARRPAAGWRPNTFNISSLVFTCSPQRG